MKIMDKKKENTTKYLVLRNTEKGQLFRKKIEFQLPILKRTLLIRSSDMELFVQFPLANDLTIQNQAYNNMKRAKVMKYLTEFCIDFLYLDFH